MKSKEILTIFALIFLGLCLLLNLGNKSSLQKWGNASMFIAIVLLAVGQLLGETEKFDLKAKRVPPNCGAGCCYRSADGVCYMCKDPCKPAPVNTCSSNSDCKNEKCAHSGDENSAYECCKPTQGGKVDADYCIWGIEDYCKVDIGEPCAHDCQCPGDICDQYGACM